MLIALLLAAAVAAGAPTPAVIIVALAIVRPWWFLAAALAWALWAHRKRRRRHSFDDEARFLQGIASEVGAGSSLRSALPAAATRSPDLPVHAALRLAGAGRPMPDVADALKPGLPVNGSLVAAAMRLASTTGAPMGPLFTRLSVRAAERGELAREQRALTAQARLSAVVVGGAPLLLVGMLWVSGRGATFFETGATGLLLGAVGLGLEAAGAAAVWIMIRRADI